MTMIMQTLTASRYSDYFTCADLVLHIFLNKDGVVLSYIFSDAVESEVSA